MNKKAPTSAQIVAGEILVKLFIEKESDNIAFSDLIERASQAGHRDSQLIDKLKKYYTNIDFDGRNQVASLKTTENWDLDTFIDFVNIMRSDAGAPLLIKKDIENEVKKPRLP